MKIKCYDLRRKENEIKLVEEDVIDYKYNGNLTSTDSVANFIKQVIKFNEFVEERFYAIGLDNAGKIIGVYECSKGGYSSAIVDVGKLLRTLIVMGATNYIVVHNHPSNNVSPSAQDNELTHRLIQANFLGLKMLDHIIIGNSDYYSYRNKQGEVFD